MKRIETYKHIAIIQTAFLGDVALSLYLTQKIRNIHPNSEITFVTTPSGSPLVACSTAVDNVITYDKRGLQTGLRGIKFISSLLKDKKVDCIISPHKSLRSTLLTFITKPEFSVSFYRSALSVVYSKRIKYFEHQHEIERNISLMNAFSDYTVSDIPTVELEFDEDDISYIDYKLYGTGIREDEKIVLVAPGSIWKTKRWGELYYARLCNLLKDLKCKVILIGSKDDWELCSGISVNSGAFNWAGETSIPKTLVLMKKSSLTITNDSSPTHFAGLVGCPVITIFGPTSPKFGFAPRGEKSKVIELHNLKCKPCTIHGSHTCPIKTHDCMIHINPKTVFEQALELLNL
ncbi:MAG: glycosyltransferase family 9 protein [Bacteroidetes bacterium]|nr:MAG: glycosyltransferase family 9 protein [Bacteroidota bacterium]